MSKASTRSLELGRASSFAPTIDTCVIVPIAACVYAAIVSPLLIYVTTDPATIIGDPALHHAMAEAPRVENKIFWPALAAISVVLVIRNWSRLTLPPHIICLFAYLALAGASVLWAFKPDLSFIRFTQQVMILTSIVLPAMLAARTADMMRALFLCFAFALILNVFFVLDRPPSASNNENFGYAGYLADKNSMGQLAAIAFFLALHEGWGYQSFWLVGPDAPSIVDASGWISVMPHAHNGYLDVRLETGVIGFALFVSFIITTLYAIGRVADRNPVRAWIMLSLALFVILDNFLETVWMRGFSFLWVVFVIVAAEAGRYSRPFLPTRAAYGSRTPRPGSPGLSRGLRPLDSHKNPPP
jgi:hypothetical protein